MVIYKIINLIFILIMNVIAWGDVLSRSLKNIWLGISSFIPTLLAAIVVLIVGWLIGEILFKLVESLIKFAKLDGALRAAGFEIFGLQQVTTFLSGVVLGYLPQVIVAVLIILVAAIVAEAMQKVVVGAAKAANMKSVNFAGSLTKWAIWIFAILAAISQLGIAVAFIQTLFTGIVIALALALGLSFGLGGQEAAARYIEKIRGDISDNK